MDEKQLEMAEALQSNLVDAAVQKHRSKVPPEGYIGKAICDCGEPIPMGRRQLGYDTCLHCASRHP